VIAGDFDSVSDAVRETFENVGSLIHQDKDQNTTDFDKSIDVVTQYELHNTVFPFFPPRLIRRYPLRWESLLWEEWVAESISRSRQFINSINVRLIDLYSFCRAKV
jgi:thiamine pyrophosphokinase